MNYLGSAKFFIMYFLHFIYFYFEQKQVQAMLSSKYQIEMIYYLLNVFFVNHVMSVITH